MNLKAIILSISLALTTSVASANSRVSPEISAFCEKQWGVDYEMRLYCQKKQMKAQAEINASSGPRSEGFSKIDPVIVRAVKNARSEYIKTGITGLRIGSDKCHEVSRKKRTVDTAKYCYAFDYFTAYTDYSVSRSLGVKVDLSDQAKKIVVQVTDELIRAGVSSKIVQTYYDSWSTSIQDTIDQI